MDLVVLADKCPTMPLSQSSQCVSHHAVNLHGVQVHNKVESSFPNLERKKSVEAHNLTHMAHKSRVGHAFFCILYKRMPRSLRSFAIFIKECSVLCVLLGSL